MYSEASFSPISTDSLYFRVAEMSRFSDFSGDDNRHFTLAHARRVKWEIFAAVDSPRMELCPSCVSIYVQNDRLPIASQFVPSK